MDADARWNDGMTRFAWIIVAAFFVLVAFALGWSFTHLEQTAYYAG